MRHIILWFLLLSPSLLYGQANPFVGSDTPHTITTLPSGGWMPRRLLEAQLDFREKIGDLIARLREEGRPGVFWMFILVSFLYGFLHALGPGHRKTIIFSTFVSHPARPWDPLALGSLSALLHAGTAVILILLYRLLTAGTSLFIVSQRAGLYLEGITFLLLAVLAMVFLIHTFLHHHPSPHDAAVPPDRRSLYLLIITASLIPCPGATMLLIFAITQQAEGLGLAGVLAMSAGMAVVISAFGYLGYAGRTGAFSAISRMGKRSRPVVKIIEAAGYGVIFLFSLWMASPFIVSLLRL
ncbi:nickel/cobalt transporter [Spirochaeta thermophila]|uniref:Nickel/cobalt efflux system n=1 Tax=Winmispira thermophila (strain ATCC 49972 / DSM 6192 / RI 19.B1) TaxID=665571 RepID=E0RTT5_WINT6|nr:hypothetical protein [Spirochaeta thermophila]ADN02460.1 hypothetical protein STHERM_c15200 [Spirochaeta thermophila DSM 6192]